MMLIILNVLNLLNTISLIVSSKPSIFQRAVIKKGERGIWQRRSWEHCIRNEADYRMHVDYIHMNSVKHGCVKWVQDWQYSSFHRFVADGLLPVDWGG